MPNTDLKIPEDINLDVYKRTDGSIVVHIDTPNIPENEQGPMLTIYINDDTDSPIWNNR